MPVAEHSRCHCFFEGNVQGVGFRYCTRNIAIRYDVTGFVRNLPDGRVELIAEGPQCEVDHFLEAIRDRMKAHIRAVDAKREPVSGTFGQFIIGR